MRELLWWSSTAYQGKTTTQPSSNSFPQALQWNGRMGAVISLQHSSCSTPSRSLTSPATHVSLPWNAILPKLILSGLPIGSSSSRTALIWIEVHEIHLSGANCPSTGPHGQQLPPDPLLLDSPPSMGYRSSPESAPEGVLQSPQPHSGYIHLLHWELHHRL